MHHSGLFEEHLLVMGLSSSGPKARTLQAELVCRESWGRPDCMTAVYDCKGFAESASDRRKRAFEAHLEAGAVGSEFRTGTLHGILAHPSAWMLGLSTKTS